MSAPENPSAFPLNFGKMSQEGMTLRDWFAGQCDLTAYAPVATFQAANGRPPSIEEMTEYVAKIRYLEADAMLAERALARAS